MSEQDPERGRHTTDVIKGLFQRVLDHPDPTEEAATRESRLAAFSLAASDWTARAQRRHAYRLRLLKALQDTFSYGALAISQAADEAKADQERQL